MLKRVKADNLSELEIMQYLSSKPLLADPRNHCNPLLGILPLPDPQDGVLVVTSMLRPFNNPRFETFGEAVAFFSQIFVVRSVPLHTLLHIVFIVYRQGLQFLHEHHIAHRYGDSYCVFITLTILFL